MFAMDTSPLPTGAKIITGDPNKRSQFTITATWTPDWSCSFKVNVELWRIHSINGDETWNNFRDSGDWLEKLSTDSGSFGHEGCAADYLEFDFTRGAQQAADAGWDVTTLGVRATSEHGNNQWLRMKLNPGITVWYNRPPKLSLGKVNGKTCSSNSSAPVLIGRMSGRQAPVVSTRVDDPDRDTIKKVEYNWYSAAAGKVIGYDTTVHAPGTTSQLTIPPGSGELADGNWSLWARAWDGNSTTNQGWGPWYGGCYFKIDSHAPDVPAPTITPVANPDGSPPTYSEDTWGGGINVAGSFTFSVPSVPGAADVHHYKWSTGTAVPATVVAAGTDAGKTSAPVVIRPPQYGPYVINVMAEDQAGNPTSVGSSVILVSPPECPQGMNICAEMSAGFWRLTEGTGTQSTDVSGRNHRLVFGAGTSWGALSDGRLGNDRSVRFSGGCGSTQTGITACQNSTDATGKVPVIRTDQSFTVTAWVKLNSLSTHNVAIVSQVGEFTAGFALHYWTNAEGQRWVFDMQRPDKVSPEIRMAKSTADVVPTTEWTHLAGVYDAAERKLSLFVNGHQMPDHDDATRSPIDFAQDWNATGSLQVGRSKWGGNFTDALDGWVSDVHVYPGAFTDASDFLIFADMSPDAHATVLASGLAGVAAAEPIPEISPQLMADGSGPLPCDASGQNLTVSRDQIIKRAKSWLGVVPYSQERCWRNRYGDYRQDCSGYVSMAWGLSRSRWTGDLLGMAHQIGQSDLRAGDALFRHDDAVQHVAIFVRWSGGVGGSAVVYEEFATGTRASQRTWPADKVDSFKRFATTTWSTSTGGTTGTPTGKGISSPGTAPVICGCTRVRRASGEDLRRVGRL